MTLPRSVADVIAHHITWELESIDRMYCNVYVPQLQREGGVVAFFRHHRGYPFASSALMDPISSVLSVGVREDLDCGALSSPAGEEAEAWLDERYRGAGRA